MQQKNKLNTNIPDAIAEFLDVMNEFKLKKDIYKILFRGKGLEFEAFRDFSPDDDAADIDWKTSSRSQKLLVKQYKEERDLKIVFLVDVGSNMVFGSTEKLKCGFTAELVAAFSKLIMDGGDRVGLFLFSNGVKEFITPKNGERHFHLLIDKLTDIETYGGITDIDKSLDFALQYLDKSIFSVIVISDFLRVTHETERKLTLISSKFETILVRVRDPLDFTLPEVSGEVALENPYTGQQMVINPKVAKSAYEKYALAQSQAVEEIFKRTQADYLDLTTNKSFAVPLSIFLKGRLLRK